MPVTEVELKTAHENLHDSEILQFKINIPEDQEFCPKVSIFKDKADVQNLWVQINNKKR